MSSDGSGALSGRSDQLSSRSSGQLSSRSCSSSGGGALSSRVGGGEGGGTRHNRARHPFGSPRASSRSGALTARQAAAASPQAALIDQPLQAPTAAAAEMTTTSEVSRSSSGAKYGAFSAKDAKYGTFSAKTAEGGTGTARASGEGASRERASCKIGWVTLMKEGRVKLVSSRVQLGPGSRRQYSSQWERQRHTKQALADPKPSVDAGVLIEREVGADPSGIGFGFGGVEPGTLHAHGELHEVHRVSYALSLAGTYFLHVRLRHQALPLPGSPFKLVVRPGAACARTSRLLPGVLRGKVGGDADSGCQQTLQCADQVGNECIAGGAPVEVRCFTEDGLVAAPGMETTVTDLKDGTYTIRWRSKFSGKFRASVQIGDEDVRGSPVQIALVSSTPELNKSELSGGGLTGAVAGERSHFRIKFVDAFGNIALPGPSLKFGLVLEKERQKLTAATESMQFEGVWEKGDTGVYKIQFVAKAAGTCSLHVWCDLEPHPGERTRTAFPGSPFSFVVVAGPASAAVSRVDGWSKVSKEERSVGGKKSVDMAALDNATIVAGDSLSIRPQIYDSWGNPTVLPAQLKVEGKGKGEAKGEADGKGDVKGNGKGKGEGEGKGEGKGGEGKGGEGKLKVFHEAPGKLQPDGTLKRAERVEMTFTSQSRGGQTTYDIRYDAHLAGTHQMYIKLDGQHIIGSPLSFYVQPDRPEPTLCKLHPPPDPLYPDLPHVFTLVTFDRFHNKCVTGGLILTNRLQIVKQNVHDQTALMPNNHSFVTVDQGDGTYHLILQTIMPCSLRLMVNLDKNLGNNSGELPGLMVQVVPDLERPDSGRGSDGSGSPLTSNQKNAASFTKGIRSRQSTGELSKLTPVKQADDSGSPSNESSSKGDDSAGDSGGTISAFGSGIISAFGSGASSIKGSGTERLQKGVKAVMLGFGGSEQRRKKDALLMAVEVFVDGHGAIDSDHSKTAPNPDLFERATSSASSERRVRIESR